MLQNFGFSQAQGPVRQIDAKGNFFRYEAGSAGGLDPSIQVRADGNDLGTYLPGDAITLPVSVKRWEIVPVSVGCVGRVRIGAGRVESSRLLGSVSVVDEIPSTVATAGGNAASLATTAGASTQILAPVAGLQYVVRAYSVAHKSGATTGAGSSKLVASPVPVTTFTGAFLVLGDSGSSNLGSTAQSSNLDLRKRLPAGWGVYLFVSIANEPAQSASCIVSYDQS